MAISLLRPVLTRCSPSFTRAEPKPTPTVTAADKESRPTSTFFRQASFTGILRSPLIRANTSPHIKISHDTTQCKSCHAQVIDAADAALHVACLEKDTTADAALHVACLEKDTTVAKRKAEKAKMITKSRVHSLRDFFGIASPAVAALKEDEKKEYDEWHAYARQEKEMRQRYEEIAEDAADVEVMLRGWRVNRPPPRLSAQVLALVNTESATRKGGICESGEVELLPLSEDIIWYSLSLNLTPPSWANCQICDQCPASTFPALRAMYRLSCGHYLHVKCFEEDYERWLGSSCSSVKMGARECIRCKGLKDLIKGLPRAELDARILRMGDKLLHWK